MKVSIVIPVYYNEDNLYPLYADIKERTDYMQTNLLNTQLLFSTKYRTLHPNKM